MTKTKIAALTTLLIPLLGCGGPPSLTFYLDPPASARDLDTLRAAADVWRANCGVSVAFDGSRADAPFRREWVLRIGDVPQDGEGPGWTKHGHTSTGKREVLLEKDFHVVTAAHEVGHALGLPHSSGVMDAHAWDADAFDVETCP